MRMSSRPATQARARGRGIWDSIRTLGYAVLIALVFRTFLFEPFNIPSGSMMPTLLIGDYLFVSKYAYGYSRHSFPLSFPPFEGRIFGSVPARGDVAVFKLPSDGRTDYIKRIMGLPGDHLRMDQGTLIINGEPVERIPDGIFVDPDLGNAEVPIFEEVLADGREYQTLDMLTRGPLDTTPEFVVPEGHVFAMGDNRDNSQDSRTRQVGFVPIENLVGRAELIFFSKERTARWWELWEWPTAIRWGRLFRPID